MLSGSYNLIKFIFDISVNSLEIVFKYAQKSCNL